MIISLLARLAFPNDILLTLIQKNSKKPEKMLEAYNLCMGEFSITQIAKKTGIAAPSLSDAVNKWEKMGIIMLKGSRDRGHELNPIHLYLVNESSKK